MRAERTIIIGNTKVEEFYWNGELVCYVNQKAVAGMFDEICNWVIGAKDHEFELNTLHG